MSYRLRAVGGKWDGEVREVKDDDVISVCFEGHERDHENEYVWSGEVDAEGIRLYYPLAAKAGSVPNG